MNLAVNIGVEDVTQTIVRYLLLIGAAFQVVCLGACIFLPDLPGDSRLNSRDTESDSSQNSTPQNTPRRPHHKNRKGDKKKRR